jgi:hypothetical protein
MIATPIYDQMLAERGGRPPGGLAEEDFTALLLPPPVELPVADPEDETALITEASSLLPAEVERVVLVKAPKAPVDDNAAPDECLDSELCTKADPCPVCGPEEYDPDPEETQEMKTPENPPQAPPKVSEKKVSSPAAGRVRTRTRTGVVNGKK